MSNRKPALPAPTPPAAPEAPAEIAGLAIETQFEIVDNTEVAAPPAREVVGIEREIGNGFTVVEYQ